jgi:hypothetical protein
MIKKFQSHDKIASGLEMDYTPCNQTSLLRNKIRMGKSYTSNSIDAGLYHLNELCDSHRGLSSDFI